MNKQQLASHIFETANNMRSKIDASEYKNYILGFIFYKFLSEKEYSSLIKEGFTKQDLKETLNEDNEDIVKYCQNTLGYFIEYNNLFSTWLEKGHDFDASNVTDSLSTFSRLINPDYKKVFDNIFLPLETGLSKLGTTTVERTKSIRKIIELIKDIPMDDKQGYDVLGFIYEYLLSMFAANAGKKAGEFYTPHEVSVLMSEIVADHLKYREKISIYDPTSGSGSLLITIGKSALKYLKNRDRIKYYAQELKEDTYALTRMNLVMRGIKPENIITRNGDTLVDDWPYFEEGFKESTYETLFVDAVVSNPPYSQRWEPKEDARFSNYGLAPKTKADYAFLLHDLYHLKQDGIMTIVLPHGVLFRGGSEGDIRTQLVENGNIETIIGLPSNIFYGTGIPTIIMILKKNRLDSDILFIDASKCFEKVGKNNKLRACDIKKILDAVKERKTIPNFATLVDKETIINNEYNLNIPRYVDSSEKIESYDLLAMMKGGIPNHEIDNFNTYWDAFPNLKDSIFKIANKDYSLIKVDDLHSELFKDKDINIFLNTFKNRINEFRQFLVNELIYPLGNGESILDEENASMKLFEILEDFKLIEKYEAYQILDTYWQQILIDLEIFDTESLDSLNKIDPKMITKKKNDVITEVQDGWQGRILPFTLIEKEVFSNDSKNISDLENSLTNIISYRDDFIENISDEEKEEINEYLNDDGDSFDFSKLDKFVKKNIKNTYNDETIEFKLIQIGTDKKLEKELSKQIKEKKNILTRKTIEYISSINIEDGKKMLCEKWITPIVNSLVELSVKMVKNLCSSLLKLKNKYDTTLFDISNEISTIEAELLQMLGDLNANENDLKGLKELSILLGGTINEKNE